MNNVVVQYDVRYKEETTHETKKKNNQQRINNNDHRIYAHENTNAHDTIENIYSL